MSYDDYEARKAKMVESVPKLAEEIGRAFEDAPPKVKGAFFIVAAATDGGVLGGVFGTPALFNSMAQDVALEILKEWMVETFDWYKRSLAEQAVLGAGGTKLEAGEEKTESGEEPG